MRCGVLLRRVWPRQVCMARRQSARRPCARDRRSCADISRRLRQPPAISHRVVVRHRLADHGARRAARLSNHLLSHQAGHRRGQSQRLRAASTADRALRASAIRSAAACGRTSASAAPAWGSREARDRRHRRLRSIAGRSSARRPGLLRAKIDAEDFSLDLTLARDAGRRCSTAMPASAARVPQRRPRATTTACRICGWRAPSRAGAAPDARQRRGLARSRMVERVPGCRGRRLGLDRHQFGRRRRR